MQIKVMPKGRILGRATSGQIRAMQQLEEKMEEDSRVFWRLFVIGAQALNYYWQKSQALSSRQPVEALLNVEQIEMANQIVLIVFELSK